MPKHKGQIGPFAWRAADGAALAVESAEFVVKQDDVERITGVRLLFELPWDEWQRVDRGRWFHLEPDARGPVFGGAFDPEKPLRLEVKLGDPGLTLVEILVEHPDQFGERFIARDLDHLRDVEKWYAVAVTQEAAPGVRTGLRTTWE